MNTCPHCKAEFNHGNAECRMCEKPMSSLCPADETDCSSVGGDFYQGIERLVCWILDNVEEQPRLRAQKAWFTHLMNRTRADVDLPPRTSSQNKQDAYGG